MLSKSNCQAALGLGRPSPTHFIGKSINEFSKIALVYHIFFILGPINSKKIEPPTNIHATQGKKTYRD